MLDIQIYYKNAVKVVKQIKDGEWEGVNDYKIRHKTSKEYIWVCNGAFFCEHYDIDTPPLWFGLIMRHYVWWFGVRKLVKAHNKPELI